MALVTASEFLRSKGYTHGQLSKGPKDVLIALNKYGIEIEKTVAVARGISFLVDEEKAEASYAAHIASSISAAKKSDAQNESRTLHRQDRSLARAILAIADELGIKLNNQETIIDIAEYGDK
jgi:hypothetical protein